MAQLTGQDTACIAGECAHRLRSGYSGNAIAINTGGVYLPFDAHSAEKLGGLLGPGLPPLWSADGKHWPPGRMPVRSFYWGICVTEFPGRLKDSDTVILEWKIALGNIMRAAHEGDLETIKQQGSILTDTNRPGDRCATAGPNQGESQ